MLKKIVIAAVAVVAGLAVLNHSSLVKTYWNKMCHSAKRMVPPEVRLQQLNTEIANIDNDIRKNIGRVAAMQEEVNDFEKKVGAQRAHLSDLKTDMTAMQKSLEDRSGKVNKVDASALTRKLDRTVTEYTCLKETNKIHEKVLEAKKQALETAKNRLTKMVNEKEKLTLLSARLAGHLEAVKLQQTGTAVEFDDSAIARCRELANEIESRLNTAQTEAKLLAEYGYGKSSSVLEEGKSREEVLKAVRKALDEDNEPAAVVIEKD
jgi:chromosome segregation ATPase